MGIAVKSIGFLFMIGALLLTSCGGCGKKKTEPASVELLDWDVHRIIDCDDIYDEDNKEMPPQTSHDAQIQCQEGSCQALSAICAA